MKTCYLIEDDIDDQDVFLLALNEIDKTIRCDIANNGYDAVQQLNTKTDYTPDYIFMDVNMPKMNGLETLVYLKRQDRYARITVAIYSTFTDARLVEQYRKLGAALVLTKPSRMEDYSTLVNNILNLLNQRT